MSFWDLSSGESAAKNTTGEYETPGGNMEPIPAGSSVLAAIDEAKWDSTQTGESYISLRWSVLAPEEFKNRKIFHKLWVMDANPQTKPEKVAQTRDRAKGMFAAIDANAGGKLAASGQAPSDDSMTLHLTNKPMVITLMIWEAQNNRGELASGNWVSAVASKTAKDIHIAPKAAPKAQAPRRQDDGFGMGQTRSRNPIDDDEIPFD